jgi:EAL domain-containing protein (putative c-di-GMP-specific phosphodiesterase class I)
MRTRATRSMKLVRPASGPQAAFEIERLRRERLVTDSVTGLTLHAVADLRNERVPHLGIIYLQLGRFAGVESLYGWELYDKVLRLTTESLKGDLTSSPLKSMLLGMPFNGADGFFMLFALPAKPGTRNGSSLEAEAERFRQGILRRLKQTFGRTAVDLMSVYASSLVVSDDPRVRPSRALARALAEAARNVDASETGEKQAQIVVLKNILTRRRVRVVYQPVFDLRDGSILGHEALIRGPTGSKLESPDALFAAAGACDMRLELENLCLETVFGNLPRAAQHGLLFVNASARLVTHPVFLNERNLAEMRRAHPQVVIELSEKEIVGDYADFREVLERLRTSGLRLAIDDAGSGYSGLESILQLRPEFIKVANSIVYNLHLDTIKREIISALASLGRQVNAPLIAEGIETPEELKSLTGLGVPYGQGYFIGRPSGRIGSPPAVPREEERAGVRVRTKTPSRTSSSAKR